MSLIPAVTPLRFHRLLLTGANGNLGRVLRERLKRYCEVLRSSDRDDFGPGRKGEEIQLAHLENSYHTLTLLKDVDAVVHMGGVSTEQPWEAILPSNIVGVYNLYEAARINGVRRIVFASSNHVTGFYEQRDVIRPTDPVRPDGLYGVSKAFGENLAQLYFDRYGIETVSLRIGSAYAEPKDRRMLSTWLSFDDLERLIVAALTAPVVGHTVIYGASDNASCWWDNTPARHIGYRPQDRSDVYRNVVEERQPVLDPRDPATRYQGGTFVRTGPFDEW